MSARHCRDNAARYGLSIPSKTEFMAVSRNTEDPAHGDGLQVGDTTYRRVENSKYLGSIINEKNNIGEEVRARTLSAMASYHARLGRRDEERRGVAAAAKGSRGGDWRRAGHFLFLCRQI